VYLVLGTAAAACIFPIYWMFVVASAGTGAATRLPPVLIPGGEIGGAAERVLTTVPFIHSLVNSAIVALVIAVSHALLCSLAGFAFAKLRFRGRNTLFLIVVLTMTVPMQLAVIPQYMIISRFGWVDTLQAVIVPGMASAFGIFWMRQHIAATVSDELLQAAWLDGANSFQIYWRVVFPIVRPAAFVLGLLGFVTAWNDFLWPFIVLKSPEQYTVQLAIKALQSNAYYVDLGLAISGAFFAILPLLVVFAFVGRRMVAGIMDGAFKG
jgi:cellobiose transport system permease protein